MLKVGGPFRGNQGGYQGGTREHAQRSNTTLWLRLAQGALCQRGLNVWHRALCQTCLNSTKGRLAQGILCQRDLRPLRAVWHRESCAKRPLVRLAAFGTGALCQTEPVPQIYQVCSNLAPRALQEASGELQESSQRFQEIPRRPSRGFKRLPRGFLTPSASKMRFGSHLGPTFGLPKRAWYLRKH